MWDQNSFGIKIKHSINCFVSTIKWEISNFGKIIIYYRIGSTPGYLHS